MFMWPESEIKNVPTVSIFKSTLKNKLLPHNELNYLLLDHTVDSSEFLCHDSIF